MNYITDKEIDKLQGEIGALLAREPRVSMLIRDPNGLGQPWEGGINGYFFRIRRGEVVELPKSIAELIRRSEQVEIMSERSVRAYRGAQGRKLSE